MISFRCQGCGQPMQARNELAGLYASCPACDKRQLVPIPADIEIDPEELKLRRQKQIEQQLALAEEVDRPAPETLRKPFDKIERVRRNVPNVRQGFEAPPASRQRGEDDVEQPEDDLTALAGALSAEASHSSGQRTAHHHRPADAPDRSAARLRGRRQSNQRLMLMIGGGVLLILATTAALLGVFVIQPRMWESQKLEEFAARHRAAERAIDQGRYEQAKRIYSGMIETIGERALYNEQLIASLVAAREGRTEAATRLTRQELITNAEKQIDLADDALAAGNTQEAAKRYRLALDLIADESGPQVSGLRQRAQRGLEASEGDGAGSSAENSPHEQPVDQPDPADDPVGAFEN